MILSLANQRERNRHFDALQQLVFAGFGSDGPKLTELIKHGTKGRVAEALWQGQRVIVKEVGATDREKTLGALEAEHDRLRLLFPFRNLHFAACLAAASCQGLVILPFAPGIRLDEAMRLAPANERPEILRAAVAWLVRNLEGSRETGSFSPDYWLRVLKTEMRKFEPDAADAELLAALVARLERLAPTLRGGPVPRGPLHGDFSSQNLHWDNASGTLHVFDIQARTDGPISMDLARLLSDLTFKRLRDEPRATILHRGHCIQLRHAAMSVPGLDHPDDPGGFMDFSTGFRLGIVLLGKLDHPLGPHVRQAIRNWLESVQPG